MAPSMDNSGSNSLPILSDQNTRNFLGSWEMAVDLDSLTAEIRSDREPLTHINVTSFVPSPIIAINSYNPSTNVLDVDVTIRNTSPFAGYDVRLIIFTDSIGHKLLNSDSWTALWDIPGGLPINPFKAYAKSQPNRLFPGKIDLTENLLIRLPGGNPLVRFAIDASFPSNCEEPYEIRDFSQGTLYDTVGSSTQIQTTALDWQNNVNSVNLYCPAITGIPLFALSPINSTLWGATLYNNTGASEGNYTGYLIATSSNSGNLALYNEVVIHIEHSTSQVEPVGDVSVKKIMRGEEGVNYMRITSVHFDWDDSAGAVEYAIERADGWTPGAWTVIGTSTSSAFRFVPSGPDLDEDYRFRVIARAVPGGDPLTDASPSEEVFILFVSDAGYETNNMWTFTRQDPTDGIYMTLWWGGGDEWRSGMIGVYGNNELDTTNSWAITHTNQPIPDIIGQKEAFSDGYLFPGYNWDVPTLGLCIGTVSQPNPSGETVCDFTPANDIYDPSYHAYDRFNIQGLNEEFCETHQSGWHGHDNNEWKHVGYFLNDLLDPNRDYIAFGFANGDDPLPPGG